MHMYCKKCKKHQSNKKKKSPPQKILVSKNKIKGRSKCAVSLTKRTCIDEIEGDLEIGLEIYLHFFTD